MEYQRQQPLLTSSAKGQIVTCSFVKLSTAIPSQTHYNIRAFPTHVGMTRKQIQQVRGYGSFPHSRGDDPVESADKTAEDLLSPLTWG